MFHKVRTHPTGHTPPHGADGGVVANLTDPPYSAPESTLRELYSGTRRGNAYLNLVIKQYQCDAHSVVIKHEVQAELEEPNCWSK